MTVLPSVSDVADKAVSTEDVKGGGGGGGGAELARLEAVLSALVEGKLEALRAGAGRSAGRPRRPSSSSLSSSQPRDPRRPAPAGVRAARHACCSAAQPAACDADEQLALGFADEPCGPEDGTGLAGLEAGFRQSAGRPQKPRGGRRGRRRRGRRPRAARLVDVEADELELGSVMVDPDDLPPRARWTIMATACLLLAMSLLLVGVTLRMAPIIDEMAELKYLEWQSRNAKRSGRGRAAASHAEKAVVSGPSVGEMPTRVPESRVPSRSEPTLKPRPTIFEYGTRLVSPTEESLGCRLLRAYLESPGAPEHGRRRRGRPLAATTWPAMDATELDCNSRRRLSSSSEERTLFHVGELSAARRSGAELPSPGSDSSQQRERPRRVRAVARRSSCAQCGPGPGGARPRRQRRPSEFAEASARRGSAAHQQQRSRANSCSRPTPLGDGRRASACKRKSSSGSGGRRASSAAAAAAHYRRDSVRPDNSRSPSTAGGLEAALKDPREEARTRRHRLVALVLLAIFAFILLAAVLAVVITLTHSSFHVPPIGSRELAEHRANDAVDPSNATFSARRTKNY